MTRSYLILVLLIALQAVDVAVHLAGGHIEALRILASAIILAGAITAVRVLRRTSSILLLSGALYLILNLGFLSRAGLLNPETGALRLPFFAFVFCSLILIVWLHRHLLAHRHAK